MPLDVIDAVCNPDTAEPFIIKRSVKGAFGPGGFADQKKVLNVWGVVTVASPRQLDQVPEGDRVGGAMVFHTRSQLFVSNEDREMISDVFVWQGEEYRAVSLLPYQQRGYWAAVAVRTKGA